MNNSTRINKISESHYTVSSSKDGSCIADMYKDVDGDYFHCWFPKNSGAYQESMLASIVSHLKNLNDFVDAEKNING